MKKLLLFILIFTFYLAGYSQNEARVAHDSRVFKSLSYDAVDNTVGGVPTLQSISPSGVRSQSNLGLNETQIGTTLYDLFSNYNIGNRFYRHEDGTIAGVFMIGLESGSPDRGTGYNYYDGSNWGPEPTVSIESLRTGWPAYAPFGAEGEIFVSHDFAEQELYIYSRPTKGDGDWTESMFEHAGGPSDLVWPKIITSGDNNDVIHLLGCTNGEWMGQDPTYVYSRSTDGGLTWDPHNVVIEGMGEDNYLNVVQDRCVMASSGNSVAIMYVDMWTDLYYVRSDDDGESWERTVVWEHPEPFFDPANFDPATQSIDTFFAPDYSGHLTFDNEGHIHLVFGLTRGQATEETGAVYYPYNPNWEGIVYWNDMMEPFSNDINALAPPLYNPDETELVVDETYVGWMQDVDGNGVVELEGIFPIRTYGSSTQPSITVDDLGRRYIVWTANTEGYVYSGGTEPVNYKHIWVRGYSNGIWGDFIDLTEDISHIFDDCVYPMIASTSDDFIHYMYQADIAPGNSVDGDHDEHDNFWIYGMYPKFSIGVQETEVINDSKVSQNYPNPFSGTTTVTVELDAAAELGLVVTNMTGQKVLEIYKGSQEAGTYTFELEASQLGSGIYFYTVTADESRVTRKMIVK